MAVDPPTLPGILDTLARLHDHKTVGYGDAWRKRGELLSIFTNLARKYDRLTVALDEHVTSGDEALLDTAADLCVYAAKYLTWLAETHTGAFEAASHEASAKACSDAAGPDALRVIFSHLNATGAEQGIDSSWTRVKTMFEPLEVALMAQAGAATTGMQFSWEEKTSAAWALTESAAQLTVSIARDRPTEWRALLREIDAMGDH
jgi:thymidylate synthase